MELQEQEVSKRYTILLKNEIKELEEKYEKLREENWALTKAMIQMKYFNADGTPRVNEPRIPLELVKEEHLQGKMRYLKQKHRRVRSTAYGKMVCSLEQLQNKIARERQAGRQQLRKPSRRRPRIRCICGERIPQYAVNLCGHRVCGVCITKAANVVNIEDAKTFSCMICQEKADEAKPFTFLQNYNSS